MPAWNWLDYLLVLVVLASVVAGFAKGFARVSIGLIAAVLGLVFGLWLYGAAGAIFLPYVSSKAVAGFIGFFVVFFIFLALGAALAALAAKLFRWAGLGWLDRLLGGGFGLVRGMLFAMVLVLAILAFSVKPPPHSVVNSKLAPYVIEAAGITASIAPRELKDGFNDSYAKVKQLWQETLRHGLKRLPSREL